MSNTATSTSGSLTEPLHNLEPGMAVLVGGDRLVRVADELAAAFQPGDRLLAVGSTGALLHLPAAEVAIAEDAVGRAHEAFGAMGGVADAAVSAFFAAFADRLADDETMAPVLEANRDDVAKATARGRSTTRLVLSEGMRADMVAGLRAWAEAPSGRGQVAERVEHQGWSVELVRAGLGVVGFVFEGRPNVFADACGVLRSGNTVVFRIGSDALGTAQAIMTHALAPALAEAGLPSGAAVLVESAAHAAGWAMFGDARLALAVARGSGPAVEQLGAVARQAGVPTSLHGTGGAWVVASETADPEVLRGALVASLDRKVCNTVNTVCVVAGRADELVGVVLDALAEAATARGTVGKVHVRAGDLEWVPEGWRGQVTVVRASGPVLEDQTEVLADDGLGEEWEWEESPEITLAVVADVAEAVGLFNRFSPRFVASLVAADPAEHDRFFDLVDAPFVGNGFTRWVDGQYAFNRPELGLSNWQGGRLFARGGVLSGDSVFTLRARVTQVDPLLRR